MNEMIQALRSQRMGGYDKAPDQGHKESDLEQRLQECEMKIIALEKAIGVGQKEQPEEQTEQPQGKPGY